MTIDHRTTAITIAMMVPETGRVKKTDTSVCDILSDWRNAFSAGVGWAKPNSSYTLDAGFEYATASTDFPDPTEGSGSGLRLFLYNRWDF